ncbi:hypothetical protein MCEMIE22_03197 [Mycobacteriaceae bacterium]
MSVAGGILIFMTNQAAAEAFADHRLATARHYLTDVQGYADAARLNAAQLSAAEQISLAGANAAIALAEATMVQARVQAEQLALHERMLQVYIEVQCARRDAGPIPVAGSSGAAF